MYLLDTDIVLEARNGSAESTAWLRSVNPRAVFLSVISFGEIARHTAKHQPHNPGAAAQRSLWLQTLRANHSDQVLPITGAIAIEWGRIAANWRGDAAEGLMAATAIVHDLILVTRATERYEDINVSTLTPPEI